MSISTSREADLRRWLEAKVIDPLTAERIRGFEQNERRNQEDHSGRNWPVLIAVSFGALMLGAGILLFIAAHWENMSPAARFSLVMLVLAAVHATGALTASRTPQLSTAMHAIGTIACGGGIFLTGQIFNLQEHWPTGVLLWAVAAGIGWGILRQWPQAAIAAVLTPAWLCSEWEEAIKGFNSGSLIGVEGTLLLALVYFTARSASHDGALRKSLNWIGGLVFIPAYLMLAFNSELFERGKLPTHLLVIGWAVALVGPLLTAYILRGREAWPVALAAAWVVVFGHLPFRVFESANLSLPTYAWRSLGPYVWGALGAIGLIAWGVHDRVKNRINLGMVVFVITLLCFYFSDLMDKLGRSVSLISFGILFLVIAYFLEKTRKRLIARIAEAGA
jgi:uncharacterized membrane protein